MCGNTFSSYYKNISRNGLTSFNLLIQGYRRLLPREPLRSWKGTSYNCLELRILGGKNTRVKDQE